MGHQGSGPAFTSTIQLLGEAAATRSLRPEARRAKLGDGPQSATATEPVPLSRTTDEHRAGSVRSREMPTARNDVLGIFGGSAATTRLAGGSGPRVTIAATKLQKPMKCQTTAPATKPVTPAMIELDIGCDRRPAATRLG